MAHKNQREIWSFFSGALGLDLGFERAGFSTTLAIEVDRTCCETIRTNRPHITLLEQSIAEVTAADLRKARGYDGDVFMTIGGPPCQSFSPAGKRAALSDPRGNLIYEYLRLIADIRPRYFVLENVANLVTAALRHRPIADRPGKQWSLKAAGSGRFDRCDDAAPLEADEMSGTAIRQILRDLAKIGYAVTFGVLDAADYGSPQHRLRFVALGSRDGDLLALPTPTHGPLCADGTPYRTVRDAIADLENAPGRHSEYTPRFVRYFDLVPAGKNWRALPKRTQRAALGPAINSGGGKTGFFRRLAWDAPAPTVTGRANRKASASCHPRATRPLSPRECARLQGFPDSWTFCGSMAAQYMQIGNAVPVDLAAAIARSFSRPRSTANGHHDAAVMESMLDAAIGRLRAAARNRVAAPRQPNAPIRRIG